MVFTVPCVFIFNPLDRSVEDNKHSGLLAAMCEVESNCVPHKIGKDGDTEGDEKYEVKMEDGSVIQATAREMEIFQG